MSSFLLQSFRPARRTPLATTALRSYYGSSTQEEDKIFPVYIHHVSKIVLQHLQDSQAHWVAQQGLNRGLQVKSNGTILLNFPARQGHDAGKIWYVQHRIGKVTFASRFASFPPHDSQDKLRCFETTTLVIGVSSQIQCSIFVEARTLQDPGKGQNVGWGAQNHVDCQSRCRKQNSSCSRSNDSTITTSATATTSDYEIRRFLLVPF